MNTHIKNLVGNRRIILSLTMMGILAGLLWFSILSGAGTASADGGLNDGPPTNNVTQEYEQQQNIANCFLAIPCW